jgi:hypothetical protein
MTDITSPQRHRFAPEDRIWVSVGLFCALGLRAVWRCCCRWR